jgi:ribosomal protein S18 acetylase RimI-like enzyme
VPLVGVRMNVLVSQQTAAFAPSARRAVAADAERIAELVNVAYSAESFFVDGHRTNAREIATLLDQGEFLLIEGPHGLAASVYVDAYAAAARDDGKRVAKISMVAVDPRLQRFGLGTRVVAIAEALATALGCDTSAIEVVSVREELVRWYRAMGYGEVGVLPYTHRPTKQACHLILFEKPMQLRDN